MQEIKIGDVNEVSETVTEALSATAAHSGGLPVFGTPFMIAMMEHAAAAYLQERLPEGKSSVGTIVEIAHTSPTPMGMKVTARAELTGISANGKMYDFRVSARDEAGPIGEGIHQRAVIDVDRFLSKCQGKLGKVVEG